jgi:phage shock protein A
MTVSVSTIISKLFMRYLESQIKNLNDVINERKEDCVGLSERIEEVEKYHIETRVSLAKIGKDIEYIKQENNKMSLNIEKILNHKIK